MITLRLCSARPRETNECDSLPTLLGAFIIAAFDSSPGVVYVEGAIEGQVADPPALVRKATVIFNRLRAEALPRSASRDLILKAAVGDG